jgi:hypothetical protein
VSSRKEEKERLRRERLERERQAAEAAARRRRLQIGGGSIAAIAIVAVVVILLVSGGGSSSSSTSGANGGPSGGAAAGLTKGPAPWKPEYSSLAERMSALKLPQASNQIYHLHAILFVYVNGKRVTVPSQIGIDPRGTLLASLHTHDATGIVHMESVQKYPFTIGEFFDIWGVYFSNDQIGSYRPGNGKVLQTWVDGKQVKDPAKYVMGPHDVIIVGYGKPGSFPTSKNITFPSGL